MKYYNYYKFEILGCLGLGIILIGLSFLEALFIQLFWNWIAPVFWSAAPILTYWQAFGVCVLLSIIGGFFKSSKSS